MNYSTLFPTIIKKLPNIENNYFSYNYLENNYNKNNKTKFFMPSGRKMLLWFLKHNSNYYSILLEAENNKITKCHFNYLSFKPILTSGCGTLLWVTKIDNNLILNKIIYLKGEKYTNESIMNNIIDIKYILDNYINQLNNNFIQLRIPVISNNNNNIIYFASSLNYNIYNILNCNNFPIHIKEYLACFNVKVIDHKNDIYNLYCLNNKKIQYYINAFVNDIKTSIFLKKTFNIKFKQYQDIEISDDENKKNNEIEYKDKYIMCIFIPNLKKWKPYKKSNYNNIDSINKIKYIENH